jgi:hypothetical protein
LVYLYGKAINRRKVKLEEARRAARAREAEAQAKADTEAAEAGTAAAPKAAGQHNNNVYSVNSMMVQAAIEAAYAAGRKATIPSVPVQPNDVEAAEVMMAPYPEELVSLIDIHPGGGHLKASAFCLKNKGKGGSENSKVSVPT